MTTNYMLHDDGSAEGSDVGIPEGVDVGPRVGYCEFVFVGTQYIDEKFDNHGLQLHRMQ